MAKLVWTSRPTSLVLLSSGGDVDGCTAIVDYLVRHPVPVVVTGRCYSAAVVIAAAGRIGARVATPNAKFFLHPAFYTELEGNRKTIARERGQLQIFEKWYANFLAARTKKPAKYWAALMDAETYLSAEQALEVGLVDLVE